MNKSTSTAGSVTLVAAPALLLVAGAIHPATSTDPGRQLDIVAGSLGRWYAAHFLFMIGFALLVPAVFAAASRLRDRAPGTARAGVVLGVAGCLAMVAFMAVEGLVTWVLAQAPDQNAAAVIFDRMLHSAGLILPLVVVGLGVQVGLAVLAVGMARTQVAPWWVAALLGAAAVALFIGAAAQIGLALLAGSAALAVALGALGLADLGLGLGGSDPQPTRRTSGVVAGVGR